MKTTFSYIRGQHDRTEVPDGDYSVKAVDMIEETRLGGHVFHFMVFLITAPFQFAGKLIHLCVHHTSYENGIIQDIPPR